MRPIRAFCGAGTSSANARCCERVASAVGDTYDLSRQMVRRVGSGAARREPGKVFMTPVRTTVFSDPRAAAAEDASARARADLTGCPWHDVKSMLRQVG